MLQISEVELNLPIEAADRRVQVTLVADAVFAQLREGFRVQPGDPVENLCFDVIHLRLLMELDPVLLCRAPAELREDLLDLRGHRRLSFVPADPDPVASDVDRVGNAGELVAQLLSLCGERAERIGGRVVPQVLPPRDEATGAQLKPVELLSKGADRVAVLGDRLQEPALSVVLVMELPRQRDLLAHSAHAAGELAYRGMHRRPLEVEQDVMAVANGFDVAEGQVEERRESVLLSAVGDRRHQLIEMKVAEARGLRLLLDLLAVVGTVEQDAAELHLSFHRSVGR